MPAVRLLLFVAAGLQLLRLPGFHQARCYFCCCCFSRGPNCCRNIGVIFLLEGGSLISLWFCIFLSSHCLVILKLVTSFWSYFSLAPPKTSVGWGYYYTTGQIVYLVDELVLVFYAPLWLGKRWFCWRFFYAWWVWF